MLFGTFTYFVFRPLNSASFFSTTKNKEANVFCLILATVDGFNPAELKKPFLNLTWPIIRTNNIFIFQEVFVVHFQYEGYNDARTDPKFVFKKTYASKNRMRIKLKYFLLKNIPLVTLYRENKADNIQMEQSCLNR